MSKNINQNTSKKYKTLIKKWQKKTEDNKNNEKHEEKNSNFSNFKKVLDKAVTKGIIHKNKASRKKKKIWKKIMIRK